LIHGSLPSIINNIASKLLLFVKITFILIVEIPRILSIVALLGEKEVNMLKNNRIFKKTETT
jgi:hypothetical protein